MDSDDRRKRNCSASVAVKQPSVIARVVWRAPDTPVLPFSLAYVRGWRTDGRSQSLCAHLLAKVRRLSARHRGVFRRPGRASGGSIVSPSARRPRPLLGDRAFEPRARREPAVSQLLAGESYCPIITTPLDDALKRARR